jgi:uncharacterized protein with HEPN domain
MSDSKRDRSALEDILTSAELACSYVEDKTVEDFLEDILCQDAVFRRLEIMGEAARRVSTESQQYWATLPWREMIGIRNVLIHDYHRIQQLTIWKTLHQDLPPLIETIKAILNE